MRTARCLTALALAVVLAALLAAPASAIPVFARKYGFNCTMCHSAMPRLNDFGQRYRMNGYHLPGREAQERTVLDVQAPVALRTSAGLGSTHYDEAAGQADETDFAVNGLDLLSAGVLGRNIGYQIVYTPQIAGQRGVAAQDGRLEMASVVFRALGGSSWANLRVGRFEPAYVVSSVKRQLTVATPAVYDAAAPNGIAFSETQSGVELSGWGRQPVRYAVGVVGGGESAHSGDAPGDVYGRLAWIVGAGEGQTAGHRLGVTGYAGQARAEENGARKSFWRAGPDVSLNAGLANLTAQWIFARDPGGSWGTTDDMDWSGGLVEASILPVTNLVLFGRYDRLDAPDDLAGDLDGLTGGARFYPADNVALHGEISYLRMKALGAGDDPTATSITARVDFAF
jgi:hypothetical protein